MCILSLGSERVRCEQEGEYCSIARTGRVTRARDHGMVTACGLSMCRRRRDSSPSAQASTQRGGIYSQSVRTPSSFFFFLRGRALPRTDEPHGRTHRPPPRRAAAPDRAALGSAHRRRPQRMMLSGSALASIGSHAHSLARRGSLRLACPHPLPPWPLSASVHGSAARRLRDKVLTACVLHLIQQAPGLARRAHLALSCSFRRFSSSSWPRRRGPDARLPTPTCARLTTAAT